MTSLLPLFISIVRREAAAISVIEPQRSNRPLSTQGHPNAPTAVA